jgi:hypothetical protein
MTASAKAGVISIGSQPNRKTACCPESRKKDQDPARIRKRFCRRPPFSGGLEERKCLLRPEAQPVKMIPIAKDASACTRKRRSMKP